MLAGGLKLLDANIFIYAQGSQHRYDEAKEWLAKALAAPNYENYCFPNLNLGRIYEFKGQWEKAMVFYQRADKENPDYEPTINAIECLKAKYN